MQLHPLETVQLRARNSKTTSANKRAAHEQIATDLADFLASGGQVKSMSVDERVEYQTAREYLDKNGMTGSGNGRIIKAINSFDGDFTVLDIAEASNCAPNEVRRKIKVLKDERKLLWCGVKGQQRLYRKTKFFNRP